MHTEQVALHYILCWKENFSDKHKTLHLVSAQKVSSSEIQACNPKQSQLHETHISILPLNTKESTANLGQHLSLKKYNEVEDR